MINERSSHVMKQPMLLQGTEKNFDEVLKAIREFEQGIQNISIRQIETFTVEY